MDRHDQLLDAVADLPAPVAVVDAEALWANALDLTVRAAGVPVRVASKSVRVRDIVQRTQQRPGWAGVMTYSLAESLWLVEHGARDVLLAYPTADTHALQRLAADDAALAAVTVMIDSVSSMDLIDAALGPDHPTVRVCLDVDASLRVGPVHLGVRRSPVHDVDDAVRLARHVADRRGFELVGLMFYDAQIAGLPDTSPAVRFVKRRSAAELAERRPAVVEAVQQVTRLQIVNAGGTGSLEVTGTDASITELTAGSGLFTPTLFDRYDAFAARPAALYALSVVRKPADDVATLFSGGYIASGAANKNRQPTPAWPTGLTLISTEGAGEVQTPVTGAAARSLRLGDRVLMRHAKAGEMCERFDAVHLVDGDGRVETLPTYRGEGRNFG